MRVADKLFVGSIGGASFSEHRPRPGRPAPWAVQAVKSGVLYNCVLWFLHVTSVVLAPRPAARWSLTGKFFACPCAAAHNKAGLQQAGITHVLCAAGGLPLPFPELFAYLTVEARELCNSNQ